MDTFVISGLTRKRAEIAGEIAAAEKRVHELAQDLSHIDAALRLFDPQAVPEDIPPKRPRSVQYFRRGHLTRFILSSLRQAPMDTDALTLALMADAGMDTDDAALRADIRRRVRYALKDQRRAGHVQAQEGPGQYMLWSVVQQR